MVKTRIWPEPKIVVIGGGSGISTILPGLKKYTSKITAIITVSDDGGSTGRLREDLGIVAPGDIRNCLVSLANTDEDMRKLFDYRFDKGELKGHSFGNLFIAAMSGVYGDFGKAVYKTADILSITGNVMPITLENTFIVGTLSNGDEVFGESNIPNEVIRTGSKIERIHIEPSNPKVYDDAKSIIENADYIVLGPGSLYTSIIPNLLAKDMPDLIMNSKAKVVYICNAVTQHGESDDYSVVDHYEAIIKHSHKDLVDWVVVNSLDIPEDIEQKYKDTDSSIIKITEDDRNYFARKDVKLIEYPVVDIVDGKIRHDGDKIGEAFLYIK